MHTTPLPPEPLLLCRLLPCPGLPHTAQLQTGISVSIHQQKELYLQCMLRKGIQCDSLWIDKNIQGVQRGDRNCLIFELVDHTIRQQLICRLNSLCKETHVWVHAELMAAEKAERAGLATAAQQAGM